MQLRFTIPNARYNIERKTKNLSIRKMWSNGKGVPEIGETLKLKDGNRWIRAGMPGCLKPILVDGKNPICTGVWPIKIEIFRGMVISSSLFFIDVMKSEYSRLIHLELLEDKDFNKDDNAMADRFAKMDGWQSFEQMIEYFEKTHGLPFDGFINYWGER